MSLAELKRSPRAWIKQTPTGTFLRTDQAMADTPEIDDGLTRHGWDPLYVMSTADRVAMKPRAWIKQTRNHTFLRTDQAMTDTPEVDANGLPRGGWEPLYDKAALDAAVAAAREQAADNTPPAESTAS